MRKVDTAVSSSTWYALTQIASQWTIGFDHYEILPAVSRDGIVGMLHPRLPQTWTGGREAFSYTMICAVGYFDVLQSRNNYSQENYRPD